MDASARVSFVRVCLYTVHVLRLQSSQYFLWALSFTLHSLSLSHPLFLSSGKVFRPKNNVRKSEKIDKVRDIKGNDKRYIWIKWRKKLKPKILKIPMENFRWHDSLMFNEIFQRLHLYALRLSAVGNIPPRHLMPFKIKQKYGAQFKGANCLVCARWIYWKCMHFLDALQCM